MEGLAQQNFRREIAQERPQQQTQHHRRQGRAAAAGEKHGGAHHAQYQGAEDGEAVF